MDSVDGSDHYATDSREPPPSLLNVVIDTNPHAWALVKDRLPLSKVVANLEVFINAHLAFNHANQVTIIASHLQKAEYLYPRRKNGKRGRSEDVEMAGSGQQDGSNSGSNALDYANFYRPFADIKACFDSSLKSLIAATEVATLKETYSTSLAGALSLALMYTNKLETSLADESTGLASSTIPTDPSGAPQSAPLNARILVVSVSSASASQYIPLMNTVFAAQRLRIPIDVLSIPLSAEPSSEANGGVDTGAADPASSFLQQAADATSGIFMPLTSPHGLLQTLLMAYLPSGPSREMLIMPTTQGVDFRAACFCHQNTVDVGYVCSVCLSIFCGPPEDGACLTCGTPLKIGGEGWAKRPAVLPKRKKKKRRKDDSAATPSAVPATPVRDAD